MKKFFIVTFKAQLIHNFFFYERLKYQETVPRVFEQKKNKIETHNVKFVHCTLNSTHNKVISVHLYWKTGNDEEEIKKASCFLSAIFF